jgi:hypothetical protein
MHNLSSMQFPNQTILMPTDALRSAVVVLPAVVTSLLVLVVVGTAP